MRQLAKLIVLGCGTIGPAACSGSHAASRPTAAIDTLPSGAIQVTSAQPTLWSDSSRAWRFEVVTRYATADGSPGELVEPAGLGLDGAGRLYVLDRRPAIIKVFDPKGQLVRTIGREGSGPGEFRAAFLAVRGGNVVIHDPQQSRTSVFDTSGAFLRSWKSSCCYWSWVTIDSADRIYIPTFLPPDSGGRRRGTPYTRYRFDGSLIDTLFVPTREAEVKEWRFTSGSGKNRAMMSTSVPFSPEIVSAYHPSGGFVYGWNGEFKIIRSERGTDTSRVIARAWTAERIPDPLRQRQVDEMVNNAKNMVGEATARSIVRLDDVPTAAPAFTSLAVDLEGNIWTERLVGTDSTQVTFDVFGPDGAWLGTARLPLRSDRARVFGRGEIYLVTEDESGRPSIARVRIIR